MTQVTIVKTITPDDLTVGCGILVKGQEPVDGVVTEITNAGIRYVAHDGQEHSAAFTEILGVY